METKKKALGKGLEQLFTNNVIDFNEFEKGVVVTDNIGELLAAASLASVIVVLQKKKRKKLSRTVC